MKGITMRIDATTKVMSLEELLQSLFWKEDAYFHTIEHGDNDTQTSRMDYSKTPHWKIAFNLLVYMKENKVYVKNFKENSKISEASSTGSYYNILKKLRDVGLVNKTGGEYILSEMFAMRMDDYATTWYKFLGKNRDVILR